MIYTGNLTGKLPIQPTT